jgi:hypothetical protein
MTGMKQDVTSILFTNTRFGAVRIPAGLMGLTGASGEIPRKTEAVLGLLVHTDVNTLEHWEDLEKLIRRLDSLASCTTSCDMILSDEAFITVEVKGEGVELSLDDLFAHWRIRIMGSERERSINDLIDQFAERMLSGFVEDRRTGTKVMYPPGELVIEDPHHEDPDREAKERANDAVQEAQQALLELALEHAKHRFVAAPLPASI